MDLLGGFNVKKSEFENERKIVLEEYMDSFNSQTEVHMLNLSRKLFNDYDPIGLREDLEKLIGFVNMYNVDKLFDYPDSNQNNFLEEIFNLFKENPKLYHQEYIDLFNKLDKNLKKLDFLPLFYSDMLYINDENNLKRVYEYEKALLALKTIKDLCKYKQVRMDWGHYVLDKIVEVETPVEEVIIEVSEEVEND